MTWLQDKFSLATPPIGMFVITGTLGIGKSVFLAYMVAFLVEQGYGIVIQIGQKFWSRQSGSGKTVAHGKTEPELLGDAKAVLLADPLGGKDNQIEHRRAGCTIVFTSLRESCYKVSYKQQEVHSQKGYMPVWSKEELVKHRSVLFSENSEAAEEAHACLGGSVRWLAKLLSNSGGTTDLASKAEELIRTYMEHLNTFDQLYDLLMYPDWQHGRQRTAECNELFATNSHRMAIPKTCSEVHFFRSRREGSAWETQCQDQARAGTIPHEISAHEALGDAGWKGLPVFGSRASDIKRQWAVQFAVQTAGSGRTRHADFSPKSEIRDADTSRQIKMQIDFGMWRAVLPTLRDFSGGWLFLCHRHRLNVVAVADDQEWRQTWLQDWKNARRVWEALRQSISGEGINH